VLCANLGGWHGILEVTAETREQPIVLRRNRVG